MNHIEVEKHDVVERYVRRQLSADERKAFQEHYFECDECFAAVETMAKFIAGVQHSSREGILATAPSTASESGESWWSTLFRPILVLSAAACILLAVAISWLMFHPSSKSEPANASTNPEAPVTSKEKTSPLPTASGVSGRQQLEDKLAQNRPGAEPATGSVISVTLNATRDIRAGAQVKLADNLSTLALRVEVAVGAYDSYQLELVDSGGKVVSTVSGLKGNSQGTMVARVAAQHLAPGKYLVKLFGISKQQRDFVGEYDLTLSN